MKRSLTKVIEVDSEKCINCHACITACPVKFCNDCSADFVNINPDMCIACGHCIAACTHDARISLDDFDRFLNDLRAGERIVAIAAPAVASNFPGAYLKLNGWLKRIDPIEAAKIKPYSQEIKMVFQAICEKTKTASNNFASTADLVMRVSKSTEEMFQATSEISREARKLIKSA